MISPNEVAKEVLSSQHFKEARSNAEKYSRNPKKIKDLLKKVSEKTNEMEKYEKKAPISELLENINILYRLIKAYYDKEYRDIAIQSVIWAIVAITYFVSPVDFIPDSMRNIGYIDDILVVLFVLKSIKHDVDDFLNWESQKQ
ncbi:YkvA family protein [Tepidibacter formicigenes]|jgi:uncharacterized membrane protein YkvA (DUF1232 family)|uniref:DUF1232 domain-containing protein n=1 Tax=Tepidibacter formicigenes DSM 15518 TaxID=1123349 RepID=A0A1M6RDS6_9FIRM|nr:DUF1232 domain-containing protein [Tepidibacter formicigenes]SHK30540.1 Protein of unknown function [Tepidibacter formicigenes DSM 15518]